MNTREKHNDGPDRDHALGGAPGGSTLTAVTTAAERLLAAGADAIDRALSADSQTFLHASVQHGGE
jgi:hypothetical protein